MSTTKIVVIGGSGLIGRKLVANLTDQGRHAVAASLESGVNTMTGEGLADVMEGADVVVDVSNSPSFEDAAVMEFFTTSTRNLLAAEVAAGVGHHIALSIVGADRLPESGYMRAKVAQEQAIQAGPVPFTILRSSQFFEFVARIADNADRDGIVYLSPALLQPVAAADVARALAALVADSPRNAIVEIAGPHPIALDELAREVLEGRDDPRPVRADPHAPYFGAELDDASLRPGPGARVGRITLADWIAHNAVAAV
jgi:uncharacterized protein YbjT (DUF2867 family)